MLLSIDTSGSSVDHTATDSVTSVEEEVFEEEEVVDEDQIELAVEGRKRP